MAQHLIETKEDLLCEGNEVINYLREQDVDLNEQQTKLLIDTGLTLKHLRDMHVETDPTTFNELCNELQLTIAPKLKFKSAIINLTTNDDEKISNDEDEELTEITVAVIGSSGVGKSSILSRFLNDTFDDDTSATIGIDAREKIINILSMKAKLRLLDTAGQEKFGSICNWYYRVSHAFIIVYDITSRDSFNDLKSWISKLDEKASDAAFRFIVGTKVDLERNRKISYNEGETFADNMGCKFCEASAKTGRNVNQIFNTTSLYVIQNKISQRFRLMSIDSEINFRHDSSPGQLITDNDYFRKRKKKNTCCQIQ
eukprot:224623_1